MQDVQDEPLFVQRVAGLDIAKAEVEVTIRVPSDTRPGRRQQETRTFGTTRRALEDLGDWLRCWGVTTIGMEATGDYWKPVFFLLESRGLDCDLYNAAQVKALPGRPKTDRADSIWLAKITERGMISSSFVPPEPIRTLRTHTRYRRHLTQARTAEKQRVEKLLEDGHLKLSSVISDIHGVSGRDMLNALAAGQLDEVDGIGVICAQDIIAEVGADMTVFPTASHLVSWAKWSPQVRQSAGKRKGSNSAGRGNPYLGAALGEAASSAGRTQSFLGARYRRLTRRMPKKKALVATGNSMLTIIHALLSDPDARYTDLGADYYEQRMHARRQARNHVTSLERLGYKVTIQAITPDTGQPQLATR